MAAVTDYTALISGFSYYQQEASGRPVVLTYSFPTAPTDYFAAQNPAAVSTFAAFNETEKQYVRDAMAQISAVSGISFLETRVNQGDMTFTFHQLDVTGGVQVAGQGGYPTPVVAPDGRVYGGNYYGAGDVWLDIDYRVASNFASDVTRLLLHEIGHAIGLKHPHDVVGPHTETLAPSVDNINQTVMSYNYVQPGTSVLGPLDVAALQYLYGPASAKGTQFSSSSWDAAAERFTAVGTSGGEILRGTGAHDVIVGGGGYDKVSTLQGNDMIALTGGLGDVNGGSGLDTLFTSLASTQVTDFGGSATFAYYRAGGTQTYLQEIERVVFHDKTIALDITGNAGQTYRLYQAAFDRTPDVGGLTINTREMDRGVPLKEMAGRFIASAEFGTLYGVSPTNDAFMTALYRNVLDRAPDAGGLAYWNGVLGSGGDRAGVLVGFSESPENVALVGTTIARGITLDSGIPYG